MEIDNKIILDYITGKEVKALSIGSGILDDNEVTGTRKNPNPDSSVHAAYVGYCANEKEFDQSGESGIPFSLNKVIQGWKMGFLFFKEAQQGKLLVPSGLAYGDEETGKNPMLHSNHVPYRYYLRKMIIFMASTLANGTESKKHLTAVTEDLSYPINHYTFYIRDNQS